MVNYIIHQNFLAARVCMPRDYSPRGHNGFGVLMNDIHDRYSSNLRLTFDYREVRFKKNKLVELVKLVRRLSNDCASSLFAY